MPKERTPERIEFLHDLMVTAIENYGYGWFDVLEYEGDGADIRAVIRQQEEDEPETFTVDIDTMAKGLGVIRSAVEKDFPAKVWDRDAHMHVDGTERALANAKTGDRLEFGGKPRKMLLLADRTNGEDGDYDVLGALAVLECALFGQVRYA